MTPIDRPTCERGKWSDAVWLHTASPRRPGQTAAFAFRDPRNLAEPESRRTDESIWFAASNELAVERRFTRKFTAVAAQMMERGRKSFPPRNPFAARRADPKKASAAETSWTACLLQEILMVANEAAESFSPGTMARIFT